ncbi:MAG: DegV family EDD domain-containing protein, partial [Bacteroidales bacterium]|nr:DegV family EDD domain-containing protein [Bacteroidales bacterium]
YAITNEALKLYKAGKTAEEIVEWSKTEVDHFAMYFFADDLKFFRRSGRVSGLAATMGGLIGLRPIIHMSSEGKMVSLGTVKGRIKAMERLINTVEEIGSDVKKYPIYIGHLDAMELVNQFSDMLKQRLGNDLDIRVVEVNPTAGSHCGPNGLGVCFHALHR